MIRFRPILLGVFVAVAGVFLMSGQLQAAPNEQPDLDDVSGPNSNAVFVEIAQAGNGISLNAPIGWTKLSYPSSETVFEAGIFDGCFENTWDSFGVGRPLGGRCNTTTSLAYITEFIFCESDANGNRQYTTIADMLAASDCVTVRNDVLSENAWADLTIALSPPTDLQTNTKNLIVAAHFPHYSSSGLGNGRINRYRMRSGTAAEAGNTAYNAGFVGGIANSEPTAVQNGLGPSAGVNDNNYTFRFGTPCNLATTEIRLRWNDADHSGAGGTPADANVAFTLRNVTTGQTLASTLLATEEGYASHAQYIGGQNAYRDFTINNRVDFRIQADDQYSWEWSSIRRSNGVQFWIPYDTAEYYISCQGNESQCVDISLSGTSLLGGDHYVEPGATFTANVEMENTGGTTWRTADLHRLGSQNPQDTTQWAPMSPQFNDARIPLPNTVSPGDNVTFTFTATAPIPSPLNNPVQYNFDWRMVQDTIEWFGETCRIDIYVAEQYDVDTPTGSSTQSTFVPGSAFDWDYVTTLTNDGDGDSRNGSDAATNGVVDVSYRYRRVGGGPPATIGGIPVPSPAFLNLTIAGNSFRDLPATVTVPSTVAINVGEQLCVEARARYWNGWEGGPIIATSGDTTASNFQYTPWGQIGCVRAVEQAYLEVHDGSVWAGGGFDTSTSGYGDSFCDVPGGATNGYIRSARLNSIGAFADYIVGATAGITSFGSGGVGSSTMTFGNEGALGNFHSRGICITNLDSYLLQDPAVTGVSATSTFPATTGQFVDSNGMTISAQTIPQGRQVTLIVQGDVTITGDITFANYSVNDKDDIPSFILVVLGDLDIRGGVDTLDGVYYSTGTIDTCSDGPNRLTQSSCQNHLTIHGSFIANDINFRRTYGGVSGSNPNGGNREAEEFRFSAEMYLADHTLLSSFAEPLPIVYQTDLPPVITD